MKEQAVFWRQLLITHPMLQIIEQGQKPKSKKAAQGPTLGAASFPSTSGNENHPFGMMTKTPNLFVGLCVWEKCWQTDSKKEKHFYAGTHPRGTELIKEDNIISTAHRQEKRWVDHTSHASLPPPPSHGSTSASVSPRPSVHSAVKGFESELKFTS